MLKKLTSITIIKTSILLLLLTSCTKAKKDDTLDNFLLYNLLTGGFTSSTCSTKSTSPDTITAGTVYTGTIKAGDYCYLSFTASTSDVYKYTFTVTADNGVFPYGITYSGQDFPSTPPSEFSDFSNSGYPTSNFFYANSRTGGSDNTSSIFFYSTASTSRNILIYSYATGKFTITITAQSASSNSCTSIGNQYQSNNIANDYSSKTVWIESGNSVTMKSPSTSSSVNYCMFAFPMKSSGTNSYSLTGMTSDLNLYLYSSGQGKSVTDTLSGIGVNDQTSSNSGTANELISNKTSTAGWYRFILIQGATYPVGCSSGSCPFTLGITSP